MATASQNKRIHPCKFTREGGTAVAVLPECLTPAPPAHNASLAVHTLTENRHLPAHTIIARGLALAAAAAVVAAVLAAARCHCCFVSASQRAAVLVACQVSWTALDANSRRHPLSHSRHSHSNRGHGRNHHHVGAAVPSCLLQAAPMAVPELLLLHWHCRLPALTSAADPTCSTTATVVNSASVWTHRLRTSASRGTWACSR